MEFSSSTALKLLQWGWGITGQSSPDWLKMTSWRTLKPKSGGLSRFETLKIGEKSSDELVLKEYLFNISKIYILRFF